MRKTSLLLTTTAFALWFTTSVVSAATYNWDGSGTNPVDGGGGTLAPSGTSWTTSAYGTVSGAVFTNITTAGSAHDYIFGGTAGTVTIGGNIDVQSLTFNTPGYIFNPNNSGRSFMSQNGYTGSENITIRSNVAGGGVNLASNLNTTFSGNLQDGTQSLAVTYGSSTRLGDITVAGSNSYTGITTLQFGNQNGLKVIIDSDARLGTAPGSAVANSIYFNGAATPTAVSATLRFTEDMTLSANRGVSIGQAGSANSATAIFEVDSGKSVAYDGIIARTNTNTGTAGFTKAGTGVLSLGGNNTYNGATSITGGTLIFKTLASKTAGTATANNGTTVGLGVGTGSWTETNVQSLMANTLTGFSMGSSANVGVDTSAGDFDQTLNLGGGTRGLTKLGANKLTLSGSNNTYTGATTVSAGTLLVSGAISNSSAVTVAAGAKLIYNSSTARTGSITLNGSGNSNRATLGGTGDIDLALTLDNVGDTLSPGNSPGIQNFVTNQIWNSFTNVWEINDWTGTTAGTDFDQIGITGSLDLSGGANSYVLDITSLTAGNVNGIVPNFTESTTSWTILTATGGITGFNSGNWTLSTSNFTTGSPYAGSFTLDQQSNNLVLTYTVPEPSACVLIGTALSALLIFRRRRMA